MKYDYLPAGLILDGLRLMYLLRTLVEVPAMATEIREVTSRVSVVDPPQTPAPVLTAGGVPQAPGGPPAGLPSEFVVGTLRHPVLRLRRPVRLAVAQDEEFVTVVLDEVDEFGYGPHLTAAIEDWQQTIAELYLTLQAERERLGPAMADLWERLQTVVEARP